MHIYTRTGDAGQTSNLAGKRLPKNHPVLEANGTLDELSAALGLTRAALPRDKTGLAVNRLVERIQRDLIVFGAYVSSGEASYMEQVVLVPTEFEAVIDRVLDRRPLTGFVVAGTSELDARFHLARTACRRHERKLVGLDKLRPRPEPRTYINRLSDLLFALAVWAEDPFDLTDACEGRLGPDASLPSGVPEEG